MLNLCRCFINPAIGPANCKKEPRPGEGRGSPLGGRMGARVGAAQLMSHHMSNFVHTSNNEGLSLVALLAFERAAFDASCVCRFNQSDRSLPAACGAQCQYAHGGRLGGMHVVSFRFGGLRVSLESTSAARTSYVASRSCLSLGPIDQPSLCKMEQVPNFKTQSLCGLANGASL